MAEKGKCPALTPTTVWEYGSGLETGKGGGKVSGGKLRCLLKRAIISQY